MSKKGVMLLAIGLFSLIVVFPIQAQDLGRILKGKGLIRRDGQDITANPDTTLRIGDFLIVEIGNEMDFLLAEKPTKEEPLPPEMRLHLKGYAAVEVKGPFWPKLHYGEMEVTEIPEGSKVETPRENIAGKGTHFLVITREEGTLVDVLDGQVELTRRSEDKATKIIRDYKIVIPNNRRDEDDGDDGYRETPIAVISPRIPVWQFGLSLLLPGTGRIYTRTRPLEYRITERPLLIPSFVTKVLSTVALGGIVYFHIKGEDAVKARIRAGENYLHEIDPHMIDDFYNQYSRYRDKATRYHKRRDYFIALYVGLSIYETVATYLEDQAYREMTRDVREQEQKLRNPEICLEVRDGAVLATAHWSFE